MEMRILFAVAALAAIVGTSFADTATISVSVTNKQAIAYSDPINVSGYIDHIEVVQDSGATSTVTIATYSGTTAIDTYASLTALNSATKLVRPRLIGQTTAGVAIAGVSATSTNNSAAATTALVAMYEKPLVGGNVKMAVTGTYNDGANTVTATIYFEPVKK